MNPTFPPFFSLIFKFWLSSSFLFPSLLSSLCFSSLWQSLLLFPPYFSSDLPPLILSSSCLPSPLFIPFSSLLISSSSHRLPSCPPLLSSPLQMLTVPLLLLPLLLSSPPVSSSPLAQVNSHCDSHWHKHYISHCIVLTWVCSLLMMYFPARVCLA